MARAARGHTPPPTAGTAPSWNITQTWDKSRDTIATYTTTSDGCRTFAAGGSGKFTVAYTSTKPAPSGTTWTAYTFDEQITVTLSNGCVLTFFLTQAVTQANQSGVTTRYNIKNCC